MLTTVVSNYIFSSFGVAVTADSLVNLLYHDYIITHSTKKYLTFKLYSKYAHVINFEKFPN